MRTNKVVFILAVALTLSGVMVIPGLAAPEKQFTVAAPGTVSAGTQNITVQVRNTTPNGNSNISSLILQTDGPSGWINSLVGPGTGALSDNDTDISINGFSPIKPGRATTFTLNVTVPDLDCGSGTVTWIAAAFTGNSFGGDVFNFRTVPASPTDPSLLATNTRTLIAGDQCSLVFDPEPANGVINQSFGATVKVVAGNSVIDYDGTVTLSVDTQPAAGAFTGAGSVSAVNGVATFTGLSGSALGDYAIRATAGALTTTATFTLFNAGIDCQETVQFPPSPEPGETVVTITRTDNESGCIEVPYTLTTSTTAARSTVNFLKDEDFVRSEGATFEMTIAWAPETAAYPVPATTFDLDGLTAEPNNDDFTPDVCGVVGSTPQYPNNPSGGDYWPAGSAAEPWCIVTSDMVAAAGGKMQVTESYLGAGDPSIVRNR